MIRIKKLVALGVGALMTATVFMGCSTDGLALYNAMGKAQNVTSMETKTDMSINISGTNLSAQEQSVMQNVMPMINSSKISMLIKLNQNAAKTASKTQSDISLQMGAMPINMSFWTNSDLTSDKPVGSFIVKMPQALTNVIPKQFQGKDYMVMDLNDMTNMTNTPGMPTQDYKKMINLGKEWQPKILDFVSKYSKQFNPGINIINRIGNENIVQDGVTQNATIYEIRLDDSSFKDLLRYTSTNFIQNQDAMNFLKDYVLATLTATGMPADEIKSSKVEIENAFADFKVQAPGKINAVLDKLKDVTMVGTKGITIRYAINADGFIINEKADAEFVVDFPSLAKLDSSAAQHDKNSDNPTGIYKIRFISNTDIKNNSNATITFPTVSKDNSFAYMDLIKSFIGDMPVKEGWSTVDGKWYYGDKDGKKKTGWVSEAGKWYCLGASGEMKTGWVSEGGKWYSLGTSGDMKTGWVSEGGKWYYLGSSGDMSVNTTIDGCKIGNDGAWIQ